MLDSSSAIYLAILGMLPKILEADAELIITKEIASEIAEGVEKGYKDAFIIEELIKNRKIKVKSTTTKERMKRDYNLKDADASVVALAMENDCLLATEDGTLQNLAKSLGLKITNTATLLDYAYGKGQLLKKQCLMLLELLAHYGYNKELILKVKERILTEGESDE